LRIKQCYTKSWIKVLDEATRQTYGLLVQDKRTTTTTEEEEEERWGGGRGREGVGSTTETKKEGEEKGAKNKH
jgi:hypothetical protein